MRKKSIILLFSIVLLSISLAVPALGFSGNVQYAVNNYDYPDYSAVWPDMVSQYITGLGYTLNTKLQNGSASQIESTMQYKKIFIWSGHGNPGEMITTSNNFFNLYAKGTTYNLTSDLPSGSLTGSTIWFQGCQQALTDPSYGNLMDAVLSKSSYGTEVYASDISYAWDTGSDWNYYTWQYAYNRQVPIGSTIYDAANTAGASDLYGFDSTHVKGYSN